MKTATALLVTVASLLPCRLLSGQDAGQKPNILWIVTDDQRPDSIAAFNRVRYGDSDSPLGKVLSPNIDRLASMGTTFINTFLKDIEPTLFDLRTDPHETHNVAFEHRYQPVVDTLRTKLQNIVLGDGRVEIAWTKTGGDKAEISNFAQGADDGRLKLPVVEPKTQSRVSGAGANQPTH